MLKIMLKLSETPEFQKGVREFKEGKIKNSSINYHWVVRLVSKLEWANAYSKNNSYCWLGEEEGKVKIGYLIAGDYISSRHRFCSDEELLQIDNYRKAKNIYPRPFEEITN